MKRLFYLSGTFFFLSLTLLVGIHIGQQQATAAPAQKVIGFSVATDPVSVTQRNVWVVLSNGDVYRQKSVGDSFNGQAQLIGNYWQ